MNKKILAIFFTMLMCLTTIIIPKNYIVSASSGGKTLFVGGHNFGNYSNIQDAINDATSGNTTIFVYDGNYSENLIIDKTINLTSESNDTIINGNGEGTAVLITADWINLTGFTIINGGNEDNDAGIKILSNHVNISNNIIRDCDAQGLYLDGVNYNMIFNNTFTKILNASTIFLQNSSAYNTIQNNMITQCNCAIEIGNGSNHNNIFDNNINNNSYGMYLWDTTSDNNSIYGNSIENTTYIGLLIDEATSNIIYENILKNNEISIDIIRMNSTTKNQFYHNNFINNTDHAFDEYNQTWNNSYASAGNYWDDFDVYDNFSGSCQNISGSDGIGDIPYNITGKNSQDNYPLIQPWGEYLPTAIFTQTVQNKVVSFNGSDSYDRDGTIANWTWTFGDTFTGYGETTSHTYVQDDAYEVTLKVTDAEGKNDTISNYVVVGNDTEPPEITSVSNSPETVGFGFNVNISADVTDNYGVDIVLVNITNPNNSSENFTMTHTIGNTYRYAFNDTWRNGEYNYTIWAVDHSNNSNTSNIFDFMVSSQATITVCTMKDNYGDNEYINITDPPNPPENLTLVGRRLTWDKYYNAVTGQNILEVSTGPINYQEDNGTWTPINNSISQLATDCPAYNYGYRTGNDCGLFGVYFKPNAQNDWPVAFTYNRSDDPTSHVIRSKLVGVGYVDPQSNWAYQYLQNVQSSQGQTNGNSVTYENVFTGTDVTWSYGNTELKEEITLSNVTKTTLQNHPPSLYGLNNESSYLVFITQLDYHNLEMYNTSEIIVENATISSLGIDFKDALGHFKCALPLGEAYELNNESVRQKLTYRIIHLNGNTYLLSGLKISDLNTMTFPVVIDPTLSVNSLSNDGYIYSSSTTYSTAWGAPSGTVDKTATYLSIGQRKVSGFPSSTYYIYRGFVLFNTSSLPSNAYLDSAILSLYKKDDYSTTDFTITIQNGQPTYPHNPLQASDYDKRCYSGNGGSLNTANFVNGRNNITLANLNWINTTGTTKLCLRSSRDINGTTPTGNEYVNVYSANAPLGGYVPKLIITYRNQSKIKNTGSTNIKGYLLMQLQYYNTTNSTWVIDNDTVNEITPRTIEASEQIGLDTIFNDLINTWNLSHGNGTYRVYAAFRDPSGNMLQINDSSFLNASYEFNVSMDLDSDDDGWTDYDEIMLYSTDPNDEDDDNDGVLDPDDIDPLINLKVQVKTKRIYASEYTYTWCEGEYWDASETKTTGPGDNTDWVVLEDSLASNGYYTRQNDSREGIEDFATWEFTINKDGLYYIWIRNHRNESGCQNVTMTWNDKEIYDKKWDDGGPGYEICWYQNTSTSNNWVWSRYGIIEMTEGPGYLNMTNSNEEDLRPGEIDYWMEVDNILITDDPNCHPDGKCVENSDDHTIGDSKVDTFDPPPANPAPDFYIKATISGVSHSSQEDIGTWWDDDNVLEDWSTVVDVSDEKENENVPITLELYDEDGTNDYQVDICIDSTMKTCSITYNLRNATWWGDDHVLDTDFLGRTCGEVDGSGTIDGDVIFEINQTDKDKDNITYWQESEDGPYDGSTNAKVTNNRYAVIVGGGASCKVNQTSNVGNLESPYEGTGLLYDPGSSWTDYKLTVDLMTEDYDFDGYHEDIGIIFRYQNDENYYILRWEQKGARSRMLIDKVVSDDRIPLGQAWAPLFRTLWYTINITLDGNDIEVAYNNNLNSDWQPVFYDDNKITDGTFSDGSFALFCWKNRAAWFDDVLVENDDGDILLQEDFDLGEFFGWSNIGITGDWAITTRITDQEDFYLEPDFVYRLLRLTAHYDENNIFYLSADKWRDADGDGENDVTALGTRANVRYAIRNWLKDSSHKDDLNLVYIFSHGMNAGMLTGYPDDWYEKHSYFGVDNNRNGSIDWKDPLSGDVIYDFTMDIWLPFYGFLGNGRLTFIIEACFIGSFLARIARYPLQKRIVMTSTTWDTSAGGITGQDWPAFSHTLFKTMADGETNFRQAFDTADEFVATKNFISIWGCTWKTIVMEEAVLVPTNSKLDDNGDHIGSDSPLPGGSDDGFWAGRTGL